MATDRKIIQIDNSVVNTATPFGGMEYMRNKLHFGENIVKIYMITAYPPTLSSGWSAKLSNLPNTIFCQTFEPCDNGELLREIGRSLTRLNGVAESTRDHVERIRAERGANDAQKLIEQIDQNQETIGYMSNIIMASGRDEEQLEKVCRKLESAVSSLGCKIRLLTNQQQDGFLTLSPHNIPKAEILKQARRNVPMSTVQGGFPFTSHGFIDQDGYILGVDSQNGLIALNIRERGDDRTNSNIVVTGISGQGKSTLIKLIMIKEHMLGVRGIVVDPEREARQEVA